VIPTLLDTLHEFGIRPVLVVLLLAAVLTAVVFLAQSVASWFDDRHS
jgi:uncharacterized membrane protein